VLRQRLDAHPERDSVWTQYAQTFAVVQSARARRGSALPPDAVALTEERTRLAELMR
jgi:hypothetical protein